jgi:hypothetical protein
MTEFSLGALKTRSVAIALLMLVSSAFARIGETEQQIEARYGKTIRTLSKGNQPLQKAYQSSGLDIAVTYIDGVSQSEFFSKQDKSELSKNEIALLLEANAAGSRWIEVPIARLAGLQGWKLEPGGRRAGYSESNRMLVIQTDLADKVFAERKAEAEEEKLKGF